MTQYREIDSAEQWDAALEGSKDRALVVFKHVVQLARSARMRTANLQLIWKLIRVRIPIMSL